MKRFKIIYIGILAICFAFKSHAIALSFDYFVYQDYRLQPYIETQMWISPKGLIFKPLENGKQALLEISMIFYADNKIVTFSKQRISSELYKKSDTTFSGLFDIQRIAIPKGKYKVEVIVRDVYNADTAGNTMTFTDSVDVKFSGKTIEISDIQFLSSYQSSKDTNLFTKAGVRLIPYFSNHFPGEMKALKFYYEIYNSEKTLGENNKFLLTTYIENYNTEKQLSNFTISKVEETDKWVINISGMNIEKLPGGSYYLVVEVRDKTNRLISQKKLFFYRTNPNFALTQQQVSSASITNTFVQRIINLDTLKKMVACVKPIATVTENRLRRNALKNGDPEILRKFLYSFWTKRARKGEAEKLYLTYKKYVNYADAEFGTVLRPGFLTDRGRVYLQYGPPKSISKRYNDPSAYPYEIWQYGKLRAQTNVRFVFYNPSNGATANFQLLHSTLANEIQNRRWETVLNKRNNSFTIDDENVNDYYGKWSDDLFNNPR